MQRLECTVPGAWGGPACGARAARAAARARAASSAETCCAPTRGLSDGSSLGTRSGSPRYCQVRLILIIWL